MVVIPWLDHSWTTVTEPNRGTMIKLLLLSDDRASEVTKNTDKIDILLNNLHAYAWANLFVINRAAVRLKF